MKTSLSLQGRKLWQLAQALFLLLTVFYMGRFLWQNYPTLSNVNIRLNYSYLGLALFFTIVSVVFFTLKNKQVYELEIKTVAFIPLWKSIVKTNLYRYLPGGIWNHAGLIMDISRENDISFKKSSKLQLLSILTNVYAGFFFLLIVLPFVWRVPYLGLYLLGLFLLSFFSKFVRIPNLTFRKSLEIFVANFGFWVCVGLSFLYFVRALGVQAGQNWWEDLYVGATYVLAWLAGFLFLPAPNGLGVREYVMAYLLKPIGLNLTLGVSFSLLNRAFILLRDVLLFLTIFVMPSKKPSER